MGSGRQNLIAAAVPALLSYAVPNLRAFIKYWLPVLLWMAVIFSASGDRASFQHSSRIVAPLLHWLFPHVSDAAVHAVVVFVRKTAHVTEYAALALLVWRAVGQNERSWSWRQARRTILWVMLYAATDEFHQLFVPFREAAVTDVLIDTAGAVLALLFLWSVGRWRKRW